MTDAAMTAEIKRVYEAQQANRWRLAQSSASERIKKLKRIRDAIFEQSEEIQQAIHNDFNKNPSETDLTEIYPTIAEINHTISHLRRWMRPKKVKTPLTLFGTYSEVRYEAKGLVLVLSPWNYPFQLLMVPLITALSAGNAVILKPSSKVPHTSAFLKQFISELFPEDEVALFEGPASVADALLDRPFDHIFFTGSPRIGKKIMAKAADHLTPVTLELGGKSPVIIDETANIKKAAERIMWGKFINAGQTCVAPDYLLIHQSRQQEFVKEARQVIAARYGTTEGEQESSGDYCRMVSQGHLEGLKCVLAASVKAGARIEFGGQANDDTRYLAPTLLTNVSDDSPLMKEEIFGPILPLIAFDNIHEAFQIIRGREKPLALYIFSQKKARIEKILSNTTAGGTCINSLVIHLANADLPFGGVGTSGMGNYHGFFGFRALSHERAVLRQGAIDTLKMFYPPYTKRVRQMIRMAIRYLG